MTAASRAKRDDEVTDVCEMAFEHLRTHTLSSIEHRSNERSTADIQPHRYVVEIEVCTVQGTVNLVNSLLSHENNFSMEKAFGVCSVAVGQQFLPPAD